MCSLFNMWGKSVKQCKILLSLRFLCSFTMFSKLMAMCEYICFLESLNFSYQLGCFSCPVPLGQPTYKFIILLCQILWLPSFHDMYKIVFSVRFLFFLSVFYTSSENLIIHASDCSNCMLHLSLKPQLTCFWFYVSSVSLLSRFYIRVHLFIVWILQA